MLDSAVWLHEGLRALGRIATLLDDDATAAHCAALAPRVRAAIERYWQPENERYADWIDAPRVAAPRLQQMRADIQSRPPTDGHTRMDARLDSAVGARCRAAAR